MPLEKSAVSIPFAQGIDSKTDPKQTQAGELITLENATFKTLKEIRKRNGFEPLGQTVMTGPYSLSFSKVGATVASGSFTASFKDELLVGDGFSLFSYSDSDDKFSYRGRLKSARVSSSAIFQNQYNNINPDSAVNTTSGYTLYAFESWDNDPATIGTYQGVGYCISDNATGQILYNNALSATTSRPRCIAIGAFLYLLYFDSADNELHALSVGSQAPGVVVDIITDINTTLPNYDCLVFNSNLYVAYNGTGSTVKVASFSSAMAAVAATSKAEVASNGICIFSDAANNAWVAYNNGTDTKAFIMNSTLAATVLAPTVIEAGITNAQNVTGIHDGTRGIIFYDQPGALELNTASEVALAAGFAMPAVGGNINLSVTGTDLQIGEISGQIIYIPTAGYFYMAPYAVGGNINVTNLGYPGNAAPTTAIAFPQDFTPTLAYSNALIRYNTLTVGGVVGTATSFTRSAALTSRAFLHGGIANVMICHDSKIQPTYFLASLYNIDSLSAIQIANFTAKLFSASAAGIPNKSVLCSANLVSTDNYSFALSERVFANEKTFGNNQVIFFFSGVSQSVVNLAPTQVSTQALGDNMHVAAGALQMYDGKNTVEHNFHLYPHVVKGEISGTNGSLSAGVYGFQALYEWIDAQGQIHRSAPSPTFSITVAANDEVTLTIPTLRITSKATATIALYRTEVNGTTFFRVDSQNTAFPYTNSVVTDYITIPSVSGDDFIVGNEQLYTNGEVENIAYPSPKTLGTFKNRLTVVPSDSPTTYWYSKQVIPGSPVEPSDVFFQNTDQSSGDIIGLAQLDDKNILFKEGNVYFVVGTGPSPSGANNDLTDPTLIATDVGLVDPASIVAFPFGLLFKSQKGIYILDRSLQVNYIGAKVEAYNQFSVVSAKLVSSTNQVRFILSSGQSLVFDYFVNTWSVFTNQAAVDSVVHNGTYYRLLSTGQVLKENALFSDNGSFISMKQVTSWLGLGVLQGFQRVYKLLILGEYFSAHNLSVSFAYDFDPTTFQTTTFTPVAGVYQFRVNLTRQKCESLQITIQDVDTGTDGESFSLSALGLEVGIKRGLNKIGETKSYG